MTRYVVVGAGAVGAALAVELGEHGHDIQVLAHGRTFEHLARHPLTYRTHRETRQVRLPVVGAAEELELRTDDVVLLAVKTQDLAGLLPTLAWQPVRDHTGGTVGVAAECVPVVTLQNGMDAERSAARWFDTVVGAVILIAAHYSQVGEVRVGTHPWVGSVIAGPVTGQHAATTVRTLVENLRAAAFLAIEAAGDIAAYKAAKLLANVRNGVEVFAGERAVKDAVADALTAEARAVFTAAGIACRARGDLVLDPAQRYHSESAGVVGSETSTWQSFARGASTHEGDYLNGEIALLARLSGTTAPLNAHLQRLLGQAGQTGARLELPGLSVLAEQVSTVA